MQMVDLFNLRYPVCGFLLKYEFNKNYGFNLGICTNDAEVCDFMTNDKMTDSIFTSAQSAKMVV